MKKTSIELVILLLLVLIAGLTFVIYRSKAPEMDINNINNNTFNITQNNTHAPQVFLSKYPIVLVHGWMGRAVDFGPYALELQEDGIAEYKGMLTRHENQSACPEKWPIAVSTSAEYYYSFNKNKGIEEYASELEPIIQLVKNCTGSQQVIIIAHSMGGLVSRQYMVDHGNSSINKLITLATPHYGFNKFTRSELIFMMIDIFTDRSYDVDQMMPESDFLKTLDEEDVIYRSQIVSIGTYNIANAANSTTMFGLRVVPSQIQDFEKQHFSNTDIIVSLDSTKLAGVKYYQVEGCSHTEILDFRSSYPKGPINNAKACPDAYDIVKREILLELNSSLEQNE